MDITKRLKALNERIETAAARAGRQPEEIELVAVTKTWPAEIIVAAYEVGLRHFGENRAEELASKRPEVDRLLGEETGITWHAIGTLQSRKSAMVADNADVFHAMDRPKIARRISKRLVENGLVEKQPLRVFLEVNVSGEMSKAGIDCSQWEENQKQRENLLVLARLVEELPGLKPHGLMTMAPWQVEEQQIRDVFRKTRQLAGWLQGNFTESDWSHLSMGMTDDFEVAIEEGATHIRVGRAIFGSRV